MVVHRQDLYDKHRFLCRACPAKYRMFSDYEKHFKAQHTGVSFDCWFCGNHYKKICSLQKHELRQQEGKYIPDKRLFNWRGKRIIPVNTFVNTANGIIKQDPGCMRIKKQMEKMMAFEGPDGF